MLTLDTRFTLTMPQGTLSDTGRNLIITHINSQKIREGLWKDLNPETAYTYLLPLPEDWDWVWTVAHKADYVGTFAKRVSKFYHKVMTLKCPPEFIQEIGNIARMHSGEGQTYEFDFVDKIEWEAGEFGDEGSCWWSSYEEAKPLLLSHGGCAIRFFANDAGLGRAWIAPVGDNLIVFNGYGFSGDSTRIIVQVMAQFLGLSYKRISLTNHNDLLYINNDSGYILGTPAAVEPISHHQLGFGPAEVEEESEAEGSAESVAQPEQEQTGAQHIVPPSGVEANTPQANAVGLQATKPSSAL